MFQCWICPSTFKTRRELKNHVVPKPHAALSVVCPWCFEEEKSFNRTLDLKAHVERKHKTTYMSLPVDVLTENNCFWLALKPSDYGRVVSPTDSHSQQAIQARSTILEWVKKGTNQTRTKQDWLNGWWKREVVKSPTPESEFVPVYEGDLEYDPTFPDLNNTWDIHNISICPGSTHCILANNNTYLYVELTDNIFRDERSLTALTRRIASCHTTTDFNITDFNLLDQHNQEKYTQEISETLGINTKFIKTVSRKTIFKEPPTKKPRISPPLKTSKTTIPSVISKKPATLTPSTSLPDLPSASSSSNSSSSSSNSSSSSSNSSSSSSNSSSSSSNLSSGSSSSTSYSSSSYYSSMPILPAPTTSSKTPLFNTTVTKKPSSPKKVQKLQPSKQTPYGTNSKPAITKPSETKSQMSSSNFSTLTTAQKLPNPPSSTVKERATNLLARGCMPLFPAARRDWDKEEAVQLTSGPNSMKWPPTGWKQMDPDRKLLAWEFAAMTLENINKSLTVLDRRDLLDKYNFLALPGTKKIFKNKNSNHNIYKSRYYTYQTLKDIASETEIPHNNQLLDIIEQGCRKRDNTTDNLIAKIDAEHIPLRLNSNDDE